MKRSEKKYWAGELLYAILFWGTVLIIYLAFTFFRGVSLNRVYGKTAASLSEMAGEQNWESAALSVRDSGSHGPLSASPESLDPYIVIKIPDSREADASVFWDVIGYSGKDKKSLSDVETIVFCRYTVDTAMYGLSQSANSGSTGTSEFVYISYVNARTGECYNWEKFGKELPGQTSKVPHYKVSTNKLLSHIKKTFKEIEKERKE